MHTPKSVCNMGLTSSGYPRARQGGPTGSLRNRRLRRTGSEPQWSATHRWPLDPTGCAGRGSCGPTPAIEGTTGFRIRLGRGSCGRSDGGARHRRGQADVDYVDRPIFHGVNARRGSLRRRSVTVARRASLDTCACIGTTAQTFPFAAAPLSSRRGDGTAQNPRPPKRWRPAPGPRLAAVLLPTRSRRGDDTAPVPRPPEPQAHPPAARRRHVVATRRRRARAAPLPSPPPPAPGAATASRRFRACRPRPRPTPRAGAAPRRALMAPASRRRRACTVPHPPSPCPLPLRRRHRAGSAPAGVLLI
jgi:hypothetical protein